MNIQIEKAIKKFYSHPAFPMIVYEAVANAIDAGAKNIEVTIISKEHKPQRVKICDDGLGMNPAGYARFKDLLETEDDSHKGLGRLVYLCYFNHVQISSTYSNDITFYKRNFTFSRSFESALGENSQLVDDEHAATGTQVIMTDFIGKKIGRLDYLDPNYYCKKLRDIFFASLVDNPDIKIRIASEKNGELFGDQTIVIDLPDFRDKEFTFAPNAKDEYKFILRYAHQIGTEGAIYPVIVSDQRSYNCQKEFSGIKVPDGHTFYYILESSYFTGRSSDERNSVEIPKENTIYKEFERHICDIITEEIPAIKAERRRTLQDITDRYPHLIGYYDPQDYPSIINRRKLIDDAEKRFWDEQKYILEKDQISAKDLPTVSKLSAHTLALYILYRNFTIQRFQEIQNPQDRKERILHELLMPKSPENPSGKYEHRLYNNNTWVLDDRFMGFTHALSDSQISTLVKNLGMDNPLQYDKNRPDIVLVFSRNPKEIGAQEKVQLVIIELKDLGVKINEKMGGITQLRLNAKALLSCKEYKGKIDRVWYYLVTNIDQDFASILRGDEYFEFFSSASMPIYHRIYKEDEAPINLYVLSLESLVKDAKSRNKIFLDILKGEFS